MKTKNQTDRQSLVNALSDEFQDTLCNLTTPELEKIYYRFIVFRSADMEIMFRQEAITP